MGRGRAPTHGREYRGAAPPAAGRDGLGTRSAAPTSPAAWPRQRQPAPRVPPLPSPGPAPHLATSSTSAPKNLPRRAPCRLPTCALPPACAVLNHVRGPASLSGGHATSAPPPHRPRAGPGGAVPGWGVWYLAARRLRTESDLSSLCSPPQVSRCLGLRRLRLVQPGFFLSQSHSSSIASEETDAAQALGRRMASPGRALSLTDYLD